MCGDEDLHDERESEIANLILLGSLVTIFFILIILTIKLLRYRQVKFKWNNVIVTIPRIRKVYVADLTLLLPLAVLFALTVAICLLSFSFFNKRGEMVVGWEKDKTRRTLDYILPDEVTTIISPSNNPCSTIDPPALLIIICSTVDHGSHRTAIRNTWANSTSQFNMNVVFLVGLSDKRWKNEEVETESAIYKDVIVENFIDTYNNLTLKSIMMLKWIKRNCRHVKLIMKADDDVYINAKNLANFIHGISDEEATNLLVGKMYAKEKPIMDRYSKWYMPCYLYPEQYYPSYVCGVGYIMSMNVVSRLYNQTFLNDMLHIEDVFITGICAKKANIQPKNNVAFQFFDHSVHIECDSIHRYMILVSHQLSPTNMHWMHSQLMKCRDSTDDQTVTQHKVNK